MFGGERLISDKGLWSATVTLVVYCISVIFQRLISGSFVLEESCTNQMARCCLSHSFTVSV